MPTEPSDMSSLFRRLRAWTDSIWPDHCGVSIVVEFPGRKPTRIAVPDCGARLASRQSAPDRPFRHSSDYREVHWHGHFFRFSRTQAAVVELLDHARRSDSPDVDQAIILQQIGSQGTRLNELFRRGDGARAWGTMIVQGEAPGSYRLADRPIDTNLDNAS